MFAPYALVSSDGPDTGMITGYYEPIIDGSRMRTSDTAIRSSACPTT